MFCVRLPGSQLGAFSWLAIARVRREFAEEAGLFGIEGGSVHFGLIRTPWRSPRQSRQRALEAMTRWHGTMMAKDYVVCLSYGA